MFTSPTAIAWSSTATWSRTASTPCARWGRGGTRSTSRRARSWAAERNTCDERDEPALQREPGREGGLQDRAAQLHGVSRPRHRAGDARTVPRPRDPDQERLARRAPDAGGRDDARGVRGALTRAA